MIYIKLYKNIYNDNNLKELLYDYPLNKGKAIHRIVKNQCKTILKDYPDIDIVVNFKHNKNLLGRFYKHRLLKGKEYKFLGDNSNPCIVLFWSAINDFYLKHNVKGLIKVLYHEYGHFKQWLLTNNLEHSRKLQASADKNGLNNQLKDCKEFLNLTLTK